jgi:hypothetical protein
LRRAVVDVSNREMLLEARAAAARNRGAKILAWRLGSPRNLLDSWPNRRQRALNTASLNTL